MGYYKDRKRELNFRYGKDALIGLIMGREDGDKKRKKYLDELNKIELIQIVLSIEFGNTVGYEPREIELRKKIKKTKKERDDGDSALE